MAVRVKQGHVNIVYEAIRKNSQAEGCASHSGGRGSAMTAGKRIFDVILALFILPFIAVIGVVIALTLVLTQGSPVFFAAERMQTPTRAFRLWKFRTMTVDRNDSGISGAHKSARVTPVGRVLRRTRLDELPQVWNILRGDISFVGPRPPLREMVERFPEVYDEVLKSRPGVTGLASLYYHRHEEWLLSRCTTAAEADAIYTRLCVPQKASLDLMYARNRSVCFDIVLIWRTIRRVLH